MIQRRKLEIVNIVACFAVAAGAAACVVMVFGRDSPARDKSVSWRRMCRRCPYTLTSLLVRRITVRLIQSRLTCRASCVPHREGYTKKSKR